jgi:DNA-binding winged helix-turn-helix (wHTH) protein
MSADSAQTLIDLSREPGFALGGLEVRPSTRELVGGARPEILEPRVMQVLVALARRRGQVVSRDDLIGACWGGRVVGDDAINRCISAIRRLSEAHGGFTLTTVARVGYRLDDLQSPDNASVGDVAESRVPHPDRHSPSGLTGTRLRLGAGMALIAVVALSAVWAVLNANRSAEAVRATTPQTLHAAIAPYIAAADCTWLNAEPRRGDNGMTVKLSGLAGDPGAVSRQVAATIAAAGLKASVDAGGVNQVDAKACGLLNLFLKFRDPLSETSAALATPRSEYSLKDHPPGCDPAAGRQARPVTMLDVRPPADFTLVGMESNGLLQQLIPDRARFLALTKRYPNLFIDDNGFLELSSCVDASTAARTPVAIEVLIKGRGPFDLMPLSIHQTDEMHVDAGWLDRFWVNAKAKGWTTQIAWFRVQR